MDNCMIWWNNIQQKVYQLGLALKTKALNQENKMKTERRQKKSNLVLHIKVSEPHCPSDPLLFVPHQNPTYCLPFSAGEMIDARSTQACVKSKGIKHTEGCFTYNNANYISCKLSKKLISNNSNLTVIPRSTSGYICFLSDIAIANHAWSLLSHANCISVLVHFSHMENLAGAQKTKLLFGEKISWKASTASNVNSFKVNNA